ncbi:MAG: hypothetical protein HC838_08840 [Spirulinaceae cyanobacterium RM2_2_10]|nr:hypothetical protein [Spirulinaceae cyanobacterium RM2_2_10]
MLKVVVGHSNDPDSPAAIAEVIEQCDRALGDSAPQAGILLTAIDFDHALILQAIIAAYPGLELIGGTTDGEISSVLGFEQDSLSLMLFSSDTITIRAAIAPQISQDLDGSLQAAVAQATAGLESPIALCIALPESLTTSGAQIVASLRAHMGQDVTICGGLTADPWEFKRTYQFCGTEVHRDAIAFLLFSGPLLFSHSVASGWTPIGKPGVITKADQNIVYEIDREPALQFYQRYLKAMEPSSEYPLAVFEADDSNYYLRAPSGTCDLEIGSITFFGDIPEQAIVQITEATRDRILAASKAAAATAIAQYPGQEPAAALFFSCASRRQILGSHTREEYELTRACFDTLLPSCGFYTNGEIAPLELHGPARLHNETFVTLLLGER